MKVHKRWLSGVAAASLAFTTLIIAAQSAAAANPTWEPDPNGNGGTIAFYNAAGAKVTSGNNLSHLFDYAVASSAEDPTGFHKASIAFAFPNHALTTDGWFVNGQTTSTTYPNASAPAPVNGFANPVATIAPSEGNLTAAIGGAVLDNTAGYANTVQVRFVQSSGFSGAYWTADIFFDTVAGTWQQVYPSSLTSTTTTLDSTPNPADVGETVTLTATVTPAVAGSVQFRDGTTNIGVAVAVVAGQAQKTTSFATAGAHQLHAVFTPTDSATYSQSTGNKTQNVTAHTSALTIGPATSINYGAATTISTTLTDTTSSTPIAGASVNLQKLSGATWSTVATATTSATGAASSSVKPTANTSYRWSYAGAGSHGAATSPTEVVSVKQVISATSTKSSVAHGVAFKIYGTVKPASSGQQITLQRQAGTSWNNIGTATIKKQLLPNGSNTVGFVFTVRQPATGTFHYRVSKAATATLLAGRSSTLTVTVT